METVTDFIFLGFKITADGDCSHEIKRCLVLGRKAMTNLNSVSPSPPAFNLSQNQGLFQLVSSSHQMAKVLEFQLQHQSFQWILRTDLF